MSNSGQTERKGTHDPVDMTAPRPLVAFFEDLSEPGEIPAHSHVRAQLIYAAQGTLTVSTQEGTWVAPPARAVWVPANIVHVTRYSAATEMRTVFVRHDATSGLPERCAVVQVNQLLRELLLAVMHVDALYDEKGKDGRLVQVLFDHLAVLPDEPLHLPTPKSRRLRELTERLASRPESGFTIGEAAKEAAMSPRSFTRHFYAETGMTFGNWQRQARMLRALELLGSGRQVSEVSLALGYESPSAFISAFRRAFGTTPARYFTQPEISL